MGKLSYNDKLQMQMLWQVSESQPGLRRTTETVQSTRVQTFLTVLNFHPLSVWLENIGSFTKSLLTKHLHA